MFLILLYVFCTNSCFFFGGGDFYLFIFNSSFFFFFFSKILVFIVCGIGLFFTLIFHIGTKECPDLRNQTQVQAAEKESSTLVRSSVAQMTWKDWWFEPQFYMVSFQVLFCQKADQFQFQTNINFKVFSHIDGNKLFSDNSSISVMERHFSDNSSISVMERQFFCWIFLVRKRCTWIIFV